MPTDKATKLATRIADYEEKQYGKISPGYPGPSKQSEIAAIARMIDEVYPERIAPQLPMGAYDDYS